MKTNLVPGLKIEIYKLKVISCPYCDNSVWEIVNELRELPAIYSPTGKKALFIIPLYKCTDCLQTSSEKMLLERIMPE